MKTNNLEELKYIILGAGPSGLSFAHSLLKHGEDSFVVLEKEGIAGGLCKSKMVDGGPIDTGGGHVLDTKNINVLKFLFNFLPKKEWNKYKRTTSVNFKDFEIGFPFESNIWNLPVDEQVKYLISIAKAGCNNNIEEPKKFNEWVRWKLGDKISEDYIIPYNNKIWSIDLRKIGTYWLNKLPDISFENTLKSCLERKSTSKLPSHNEFFYPRKFGFGEVWLRMASKLGNKVVYNSPIKNLDTNNLIVNKKYKAKFIINTIPWTELIEIKNDLPTFIKLEINNLVYSSIQVGYCSKTIKTNSHWTYYSDLQIPYHRIIHRTRFSCSKRGYWTETNLKRVKTKPKIFFDNKHAYPINTINKPETIAVILSWFKKKSIYGLGRWGEWEHYNSDIVIEKAFEMSNKLINLA